jgi:hypothetical protein
MKALFVILAALAAHGTTPSAKKLKPESSCRPSTVSFKQCNPETGYYPWNGAFLEGPGLETRHFVSASGGNAAFPPPTGTVLSSVVPCGDAPPLSVTITNCGGEANGSASCNVHVLNGGKICGTGLIPTGSSDAPVVVVRGYWDGQGRWTPDPAAISLACNVPEPSGPKGSANSAIATCINGKYSPTTNSDVFLACVRAVRADYCGNGVPHTMPQTPIGLHDRTINIMTPDQCGDTFDFEATWSKDGAVCVVHDRWFGPGMSHGSCPNLKTAKKCSEDDEHALVFTRSHCAVCPTSGVGKINCSPDQDPVCSSAQTHLRGQ